MICALEFAFLFMKSKTIFGGGDAKESNGEKGISTKGYTIPYTNINSMAVTKYTYINEFLESCSRRFFAFLSRLLLLCAFAARQKEKFIQNEKVCNNFLQKTTETVYKRKYNNVKKVFSSFSASSHIHIRKKRWRCTTYRKKKTFFFFIPKNGQRRTTEFVLVFFSLLKCVLFAIGNPTNRQSKQKKREAFFAQYE